MHCSTTEQHLTLEAKTHTNGNLAGTENKVIYYQAKLTPFLFPPAPSFKWLLIEGLDYSVWMNLLIIDVNVTILLTYTGALKTCRGLFIFWNQLLQYNIKLEFYIFLQTTFQMSVTQYDTISAHSPICWWPFSALHHIHKTPLERSFGI